MDQYKIVGGIDKPYYNVIKNALFAIPFDPANTDYQTFKAQINADEAQLESADGVVMSPDEAKSFVATLP